MSNPNNYSPTFICLIEQYKSLSFTRVARLAVVFKNCCLKSGKNCGLKSVVEQRVFSVNKTKKCVWYHSLNNIFQCSKNVKYVFSMCVFNGKKS